MVPGFAFILLAADVLLQFHAFAYSFTHFPVNCMQLTCDWHVWRSNDSDYATEMKNVGLRVWPAMPYSAISMTRPDGTHDIVTCNSERYPKDQPNDAFNTITVWRCPKTAKQNWSGILSLQCYWDALVKQQLCHPYYYQMSNCKPGISVACQK